MEQNDRVNQQHSAFSARPAPVGSNMASGLQSPNRLQQNLQLSDKHQQQQPFPMYPPFPQQQAPHQPSHPLPMHQQPFPNPSQMMFHAQNYPVPMQSYPNYPTPFDHYPYPNQMGMQSMSPFQQQRGDLNASQPLPQQYPFNPNQLNSSNVVHEENRNLSQTQPFHPHSAHPFPRSTHSMNASDQSVPNQAAPKVMEQEEEQKECRHEAAVNQMECHSMMVEDLNEDGRPKPRLEYDKLTRIGHAVPWLLNGRDREDINLQILEENKWFGDIGQIYCGMNTSKHTVSNALSVNVQKQNARLFLDKKAQLQRQRALRDDEKAENLLPTDTEIQSICPRNTDSQALLVYDHNIRPCHERFNEYYRYKLLRIPPVSSYPSTPPITVTLHLYSVQFRDLPAFTVEDFLSQRIRFEYKQYSTYLQDDKQYRTDIQLLRARVVPLLDHQGLEGQMQCVSLLDELISIRQKKDELQSKIRDSFTTIYMNWRNLQSWRYHQGPYKFANHSSIISEDDTSTLYHGTPLMLFLKKVEPDRITQEREYALALNEEVNEMEQLVTLRNLIRRRQFGAQNEENQQFQVWSKHAFLCVHCVSKSCFVHFNVENFVTNHVFTVHLYLLAVLVQVQGMAMMEEKFDADAVKQRIVQRQNLCLTAPGTVYHIAYLDTTSCGVTATDLCNTSERFRRRQLSNESIRATVFVNQEQREVKVKRTKITTTEKIKASFPRFECELQFEVEMKLLERPRSIELELRSHSWFSSSKIANIDIPISGQWIKEHHGTLNRQEIDFESQIPIAVNRHLSASDYQIYVEPANGEWKRTVSGSIGYGLRVDVDEEYKRKLKNQPHSMLTVNVISDRPQPPSQEVQQRNEENERKEEEEKREDVDNEERLKVDAQSNTERQALCLVKDEVGTFRQQILKMRQRYAISEDDVIPLFDKDIPDHLYKAVHDETKREIAYRNAMILDRMKNATIEVSEVVREHRIELMPCFSFSLQSLFRPRRRLRPHRNYFSTSVNPEKCKIIVQILQCRNLPVRKQRIHGVSLSSRSVNMVQPFVEISFRGTVCRSFTSFGANARWEQTLCVEFDPPGGKYTPSNLQKIRDDVEINIYDELVISSPPNDNREQNSKIQRTEKRYLGSVKIPFTTIYFHKNIEGFFKLEVPLIHLGYSKSNLLNAMHSEPALISMFATLDPPMLGPHQLHDSHSMDGQGNDDYYQWILDHNVGDDRMQRFYRYCIEWSKSIHSEHNVPSDRLIEIFASNSRNEPDLVCRYLRSVDPPMAVAPEIFMRFVSCIPFKEDIHLIPGARDVWMSNIDFVALGSGDGEEHSNLLCCYFMWFDAQNPSSGWSTFMAMGRGIPDGNNTMFVVRRNASLKHSGGVSVQNVILYDASNCRSYSVPEQNQAIPLCNLVDISIVYDSQQIYANLQNQVHPSSVLFNWEFENKAMWKPLFPPQSVSIAARQFGAFSHQHFKAEEYCLPSLQSPSLEYISCGNEYYTKRQSKLEYIIEKQFDHWRDLPTKWNYAICKTLREILSRLEPLCQSGGHIPVINEDPQIFAINQIYSKLYGFPLNVKDNGADNLMLESDENKAVSMVFNTKVHENDDPKAEFARAVYIYPYTNKIASVWIYIASLSK